MDFVGRDGDEPEGKLLNAVQLNGPVQAHAVFEHAAVTEQPGDHGGEVGFAEQGAEGAIDGAPCYALPGDGLQCGDGLPADEWGGGECRRMRVQY